MNIIIYIIYIIFISKIDKLLNHFPGKKKRKQKTKYQTQQNGQNMPWMAFTTTNYSIRPFQTKQRRRGQVNASLDLWSLHEFSGSGSLGKIAKRRLKGSKVFDVLVSDLYINIRILTLLALTSDMNLN